MPFRVNTLNNEIYAIKKQSALISNDKACSVQTILRYNQVGKLRITQE